MMMSLGFDPQKGRFVGTFIGSMMTHLWIYDGALDASGQALILDAEGRTARPLLTASWRSTRTSSSGRAMITAC